MAHQAANHAKNPDVDLTERGSSDENNTENSCPDCHLKFDSPTSLQVHLQYHNQNLLTKWAAEAEAAAPPPVLSSPLVSEEVPGRVSSEESPVAARVSSGAGRPSQQEMQISTMQSMGIPARPPHLSTHHSYPGQQETATPLPPINSDVSEFFNQLESRPEPTPVQANSQGNWSNNSPKTSQYNPYSEDRPNSLANSSAMTQNTSSSVQTFPSYNVLTGDNIAHQNASYVDGYQNSSEQQQQQQQQQQQAHDQSSEEIWDLDSHTVRRYNPGPDPASPGPIPTTPTMYGNVQIQGQNKWDSGTSMYSPYSAMARSQANVPPALPPQSISPGLNNSWMGPMGMKHHGVTDSKRPKSYQCEACDKWFTSSGHLKRHYNTTLHKNAMKQKGDPGYMDGINGGSLSIPSVESRGAPSPCMSLGEESSQSSVCDDVSSQSTQSSMVSAAGSTVSTPGPTPSITTLNQPATSQQDNCSLASNTSPNVSRASPRSSHLLSPMSAAGMTGGSPTSPLSGMSQLVPLGTPQAGAVTASSPMTPMSGISSPNARIPTTSPAHQQAANITNRFSPFRAGPPSNPSYKVQNLDRTYQSYPTTFQPLAAPGQQVSNAHFNGDGYLTGQPAGSGPYRPSMALSDQYQPQYTAQFQSYHQSMLPYSYDTGSHGSYIPHGFSTDISGYNSMSSDGMPVFQDNMRTIKAGLEERDSPEGSESSEVSLKNETGEFRCNECSKVFNRVCYLKQHNKSFHNGEKPFKCNQCGKRFPVEVLYQVRK